MEPEAFVFNFTEICKENQGPSAIEYKIIWFSLIRMRGGSEVLLRRIWYLLGYESTDYEWMEKKFINESQSLTRNFIRTLSLAFGRVY